jgi:hypothetical protein
VVAVVVLIIMSIVERPELAAPAQPAPEPAAA